MTTKEPPLGYMFFGDEIDRTLVGPAGEIIASLPSFAATAPTIFCRQCYAVWPAANASGPQCFCCRNCSCAQWDHADGKCLFEASTYEPYGSVQGLSVKVEGLRLKTGVRPDAEKPR